MGKEGGIGVLQGYEPFGSLLPGRNYSSGSYRFGFQGQVKDDEVYGATGTSYTAEFWQYDPRVGKRWNIDPVVKSHESPYAAFSNNPVYLIDPTGADTIKTDDKGKISAITAAKGNHVLYDYNNKQLQLNDPKYDTELINKRGVKVGDQLINYLSENETKKKVDGQGIIYDRLIASVFGLTTPIGAYFYGKSLGEIKDKSYSTWDFSHSVLGPMVKAAPNASLGKTTTSGFRSYTDDYKYEQYYFFVFGKSNKVYNLGDAGNFMWGMAGRGSGFTWLELKSGSNWNEIRQGRGFDADADQRAIRSGFDANQ